MSQKFRIHNRTSRSIEVSGEPVCAETVTVAVNETLEVEFSGDGLLNESLLIDLQDGLVTVSDEAVTADFISFRIIR